MHIEWRIPGCWWRGKGAYSKGPIKLTTTATATAAAAAAAAGSDDNDKDNDDTAITGAVYSFSAAGRVVLCALSSVAVSVDCWSWMDVYLVMVRRKIFIKSYHVMVDMNADTTAQL